MKLQKLLRGFWLRSLGLFVLSFLVAFTAMAQTQEPPVTQEWESADSLGNVTDGGPGRLAANLQNNQLVAITLPAAGSSINSFPVTLQAQLAKGVNPANFRARLNGQDITGKFTRSASCLFSVCYLTAQVIQSDGLAPGNNTLKVEIVGANRGSDARSFSVAAPLPIANAGLDQVRKLGRTIQLDGTKSKVTSPALTQASLTHRWEWVTRPTGSQAALDNPNSPTPSFVTDRPGNYVLKLVVHDGVFEGAPDTVIVSAHSGATQIPVQTRQLCPGCDPNLSGNYAIVVDGVRYAFDAHGDSGVNIVVFDRSTLQGIGFNNKLYDAAGVNDYLNTTAPTGDYIVIISTGRLGVGFPTSGFAATLKAFGADTAFDSVTDADFNFTFIGIRGLNAGQAWQTGSGSLNLVGSFVQDSQRNYTFAQFDYAKYKVTPGKTGQPATITIGGQAITSDTPTGQTGGFLLVYAWQDTLEPYQYNNCARSHLTNAGDPATSANNQQILNQCLAAVGPGGLAFLASFGNPHNGYDPNQNPPNWSDLANLINDRGGVYESFYDLKAGDAFSYVYNGSDGSAVTSSSLMSPIHKDGKVTGILARGRRGNWYAPLAQTFTDERNLDLFTIVAQPPTAWTYPVTDRQQKVYDFVTDNICYCPQRGFRSMYADTNRSLEIEATLLLKRPNPYPGNDPTKPFGDDEWKDVTGFLIEELRAAATVRKLNQNLETLWSNQQINFSILVNSVSEKVKNELRPPDDAAADKIMEYFLEAAKIIGEIIVETGEEELPGGTILVNVVSAAQNIAVENLAKDKEGNDAAKEVSMKVSEIEEQTAYAFTQQLVALGTLFNLTYEDSGRLFAMEQLAVDNPWYGSQTTGQALDIMTRALEQSLYRSLLPLVYTRRIWNDTGNHTNPGDWTIFNGITNVHPYPNWPQNGWVLAPTYLQQPRLGKINQIQFLTANGTNGKPADNKPSSAILDSLVNDLGTYKPFMLRRWGFPTYYCGNYGTTAGSCLFPNVSLPLSGNLSRQK